YSNVGGGLSEVYIAGSTLNWGAGNIDTYPLFAEPGYCADVNDPNIVVEPDDPNAMWIDGDYHLKSEVGRWDAHNERWIMDDVTSPCIDRGDPHSPVGGEPDPNGGRINMGAYGGTLEASMSIGQLPPLPPLAHWNLDETEGDIAYDSAGMNDALLIGEPFWQPMGGQIDGALQFDGIDDYVSTSFVLNPEDVSFSVFAWIKGGAPDQVIISQDDGVSWLMVDVVHGALRTDLRTPETVGRDARPPGPPLICPIVVTDGDWHRVGFVRDGSDRVLYVDDIEVARDTAGTLESASGGLYIGAASTLEPGGFFSGLIDDVRIYNRVIHP
ncbi:MAG: LamG domain-containing protein, partial [Planctomycetota bacterium]